MKVRTMVRNFIWSGNVEGHPRAQVLYDSTVLSTSQGGIKVFDLHVQASALLAKMVIPDHGTRAKALEDFPLALSEKPQTLPRRGMASRLRVVVHR